MRKTITQIALDYAREELGHADAQELAKFEKTNGEACVLVKTEECGAFGIWIVGDEVIDDSIPPALFWEHFPKING